MESKYVFALGAITALGLYYILTKEREVVVKLKSDRKKKVTLVSLERKVDQIVSSTKEARLAIVLLENLQLEVDGITSTSERRRQRRKRLNTRISEILVNLETEAAQQPANDMRGYKIKDDGTKTTYFHRDIDEESKALIGDNTPKRIDIVEQNENSKTQKKDQKNNGVSSDWNRTGNTWESKVVTKEAKILLRKLLSSGKISITKISGDVTLVMKKRLCLIYDLEVQLSDADGTIAKVSLLSGDEPELLGDMKEKEVLISKLKDFETQLLQDLTATRTNNEQ
jgi:hypothetical protein